MTNNNRMSFDPVDPDLVEKVRNIDNEILRCAYGNDFSEVTISQEDAKLLASQITMLADIIRETNAPKIFVDYVQDKSRLVVLQSVFAGTVTAVFSDAKTILSESNE